MMQKLFERYFSDWSNIKNEEFISMLNVKSKIVLPPLSLDETLKSAKKLNVKFGIDPTASNIHIGHIVPIMILNMFIKKGHNIDFVVGDFTARIGDPSGRSTERKSITNEEITENMSTYVDQIARYIDVSKINKHRNSEWLEDYSASALFSIFQNINLAHAMQRDDFRERINSGISLAEVCYAVLMGIDSVELKSDIEIGGIDQLLNFQQCREVMKIHGMKQEIAITTPILEGLSGDGRKMSKSYNNYIAVVSDNDDKFGKFMSLPDNLLLQYYKSFTYLKEEEIPEIQQFIDENPFEAKKQFATYFIGIENKDLTVGLQCREKFEQKFSKKQLTTNDFFDIELMEGVSVFEALLGTGKFESKSNLRRLFLQKAVKDCENMEPIQLNDILISSKKIKVGKLMYFNVLIKKNNF